MIDKVQILLNGKEYFKVNNIVLQEVIEGFLSIRTANLDVIFNNIKTREFTSLLNEKRYLTIKIIIDEKVWQEAYITQDNIDEQKNVNGGRVLTINVSDVFKMLLTSDVIDVYNQTHKTLQIALRRTLLELQKINPELENANFKIKNGIGVSNISLTNGGNQKSLTGGECSKLIGNMCSLYKVILKSNGVDTLTIEKHYGNQSIIDNIYVLMNEEGKVYKSNTQFIQKVGSGKDTPARIVILNSAKMKDTSATSVIVPFKNGIPFTQKIKSVSMEASYKQIAEGITYQMMGMTARANSHVYGLPSKIFNKDGNFYSINTLISVYDEERGIDQQMNIVGFSTTIDSEMGSNTTLNLVNEGAFDKLDNLKIKKSLLK